MSGVRCARPPLPANVQAGNGGQVPALGGSSSGGTLKPLPTETDAIKHAELAAAYLRTLLAEGVPLVTATTMAALYGASLIARRDAAGQEPWESEDGR